MEWETGILEQWNDGKMKRMERGETGIMEGWEEEKRNNGTME